MPLCIRWFGWWLFTEKNPGLDHAGRSRIPGSPLCHRGRRALVSAALVRINDHRSGSAALPIFRRLFSRELCSVLCGRLLCMASLLPSARCAEPPAEPGVSFSDQLGGEAPDCGDQELLTRYLRLI
jgi:hypothetical protein